MRWAVCVFLLLVSCGHASSSLSLKKAMHVEYAPVDAVYHIHAGDTVDVLIWNQPKLSVGDVRVRDDGMITLPLVGDVSVVGLSPESASKHIQAKLDGLVVDAKVTLAMKTMHQGVFSVVGYVKNNGVYALRGHTGVLQALAYAGGLSETADPDRIVVLRTQPSMMRIFFTYEELVHGDVSVVSFALRDGDVVVVE
jgi:polysaccharide export outer membrane protein